MKTSSVLAMAATLAAVCVMPALQQCLTADDSRRSNNRVSHQALYTGQKAFSLAMLAEADRQAGARDNVFFSPYSTYHALLLAYFIAASSTEQALSNALRIGRAQDKLDVMQAYRFDKRRRTQTVDEGSPYEFNSANRVYASSAVKVRDCMEDLFDEEVKSLDFRTNPGAALATINGWVEQQTRGMIRDLLPPDAIDSDTNLVLVNAAFFRGLWEYQFPADKTKKDLFYVTPSQPAMVDMMVQEGTFNHDISEKLGCHILELPYKGSSASMIIMLPPAIVENGVANVLSKLNEVVFSELVQEGNLIPRKVEVYLPKFSLEQSIELTPILASMGLSELFTNAADLSGLTGVRNVTLGRAIHKAKIEVNEEGTKAAAATALFTFRSSRPVEPAKFECNHPFIYFIYDRKNQAVLFSGIYRKPQ